jgi:hypothetical protein
LMTLPIGACFKMEISENGAFFFGATEPVVQR